MKSYKEFLTEIGNSRRPYKYKWGRDSGSSMEGIFTADNGTKYNVAFWVQRMPMGKWGMVITFVTDTHSEFVTNAGLAQAFRVMATVVAMAKDAKSIAKNKYDVDIDIMSFENSKWGDMKTQNRDDHKAARARKKLYTAFAKKELGANSVKEIGNYVYLDVS